MVLARKQMCRRLTRGLPWWFDVVPVSSICGKNEDRDWQGYSSHVKEAYFHAHGTQGQGHRSAELLLFKTEALTLPVSHA